MSAPTILVVDYEPNSLQKMKSLLEANSYRVETATDGLMAIKRFEAFRPNLVLLSAMLPKLHGFEACQKIKASSNGENVPVIIMTSIYKGRKYRHDALTKYGASEYLEKPFEDDTLLQHIRDFLVPGAAKARAAAVDPEAEADADVQALLDDEDDIPELMDDEEPGDRTVTVAPPSPAPSPPTTRIVVPPPPPQQAPQAAMDEMDEEIVEEVEEVIGDDEQTMTVDPEVARAAVESALASVGRVEERRGLTSREIFSDVIAEVEQHVGEDLKRIAIERASASRDGAHFVDGSHAAAAPAPPATPHPARPTPAPARAERTITAEVPVVHRAAPPPPPAPVPPGAAVRSRARTSELPAIDDIVASVERNVAAKTAQTRLSAASSQDVFKQKLEETLTGLGIPVKKEPRRRPSTQELDVPAVARPVTAPLPAAPPPAMARSAGTPAPPPVAATAPHDEGVQFGNYTLLEKIAAGGMAELFKAKMQGVEGFRKLVAIKRILPHLTDNEEFVHMFIDEAKLAAQLNHQNIAHIFDLGRIEKFYYIAMEYVAGKDLRGILKVMVDRSERLPVELSVLVASKVAAALDYAHRKKDFDGRDLTIVHRDISPQNVLISYEGEVKLVDFGIAKAVSRSSQTESGTVKGKLLYMSPEQARGSEIDKRSDIFSLGVVLYEMLTGEKLFMDETEMEIIRRVRDCKVASPRRLNPAIPKELDLVVMTALEKRPEDRYQNAYKMQKDLENIMYAWESTPTSVNLAQFMAEEFRRDSERADMDRTLLASDVKAELQAAAPQPTPSPARAKAPVPAAPPPPRHVMDEVEDVDATMLAGDQKAMDIARAAAVSPPPAKVPAKSAPTGKAVPPPAARAPKPPPPKPSAPARAPSSTPGVILPDTGILRVGKEEQVQELQGKRKGSAAPMILVGAVLVGLTAVAAIVFALMSLLGGKEGEKTPPATPSTVAATTPATPATAPATAPTEVAATGVTAPPATPPPATLVATAPATAPTAPTTPGPSPADVARQARIDDNSRAMLASQKAQDWESTLRSADKVLKDDPADAAALAAKRDAQAQIAAKKKLEDEQRLAQSEDAYRAAMDAGNAALAAGDLDGAGAKADEALKARPKDKDGLALRKKIADQRKALEPVTPTAATPAATPTKPPRGKTPPPPTEAATPAVDPAAEWTPKIQAALAASPIDVALVEDLFGKAQEAGVTKDKLQGLYSDFQSKKPKPAENSLVPLEQLDARPELTSKVDAGYTRQAELQKIQGTVLVEATIDASGDVVESKVTRELGYGLDESAEKSVKKYKFKPGEKQGVKVKTKIIIPVVFQRR